MCHLHFLMICFLLILVSCHLNDLYGKQRGPILASSQCQREELVQRFAEENRQRWRYVWLYSSEYLESLFLRGSVYVRVCVCVCSAGITWTGRVRSPLGVAQCCVSPFWQNWWVVPWENKTGGGAFVFVRWVNNTDIRKLIAVSSLTTYSTRMS